MGEASDEGDVRVDVVEMVRKAIDERALRWAKSAKRRARARADLDKLVGARGILRATRAMAKAKRKREGARS